MALSDPKTILDLIDNEGYELGWGSGNRTDGHFWIQKGGLCRGGDSISCHAGTIRMLERKGKIKSLGQDPKRYWLIRYTRIKSDS